MSKWGEFTCAHCGKTYPKGRSDEEAIAESIAEFGMVINPVVVCDDCYNAVMDWSNETGVSASYLEAIDRMGRAIG